MISSRLVLAGVIGLSLTLAACERSPGDAASSTKVPSDPAVSTASVDEAKTEAATEAAIGALDAEAFRAAWGQAAPIQHHASDGDDDVIDAFTYDRGRLEALGGNLYAYVSSGRGGDGHVQPGALSIHYLKRTASGFERTGAWPEFIVDGTFGAPPDWTLRRDLTDSPTIVTSAGGVWQGYACSWARMVELTPRGPVMRLDPAPMSFDSTGARGLDGQTVEGVITPGEKGRSFTVRYRGDATGERVYRLSPQKGLFESDSPYEPPTC